jgi:hypothetical protein
MTDSIYHPSAGPEVGCWALSRGRVAIVCRKVEHTGG